MSKLPSHSLFLLLLLSCLPFLVISQSPATDERTILLKLKKHLGDPLSLQSWTATSSPCTWPEITCIGDSVTGLFLRDKNITVKIPSTICDLQNLTSLDLALNYIPGQFPIELYSCTKLQMLDMSQNYFVGPIPGDIDRLTRLQYIDLGANNFSGDIPPAIGRLKELTVLNLYQNQFNGTFPVEIGDLSELEVLGLAYNENFLPAKIPREFGNLKKLKTLWMTEANLIGEIPESFRNLSSLEVVDLSRNVLEGEIPKWIFELKNLKQLYLFHNRLSGEIPKSVECLNLKEIDFSMNRLTGLIPEDFGKLQNLSLLNLFSNQLSGEVPPGIGLIPNLVNLRLFYNQLSGVLPPELGLHSKLEAFEVAGNRFSGQLPENLCAGGALQGVVAFDNNLTGEVPKSLGNCETLRTVQLHNNRFSGEIPPGMWTAFNLSSLLLSNNSFSGELPSKMAWNLSRLEISDNRFSGPIPVGVASWKNLIVVKASNNLFSGQIPVELTSLSGLTTLLLDGNRLSNALPSEIVSWKSLTTLNLSGNDLSGEIPQVIGSLPDLLYLDLSGNQLSGKIPPEIGRLKLVELNLSSNQLSGTIPDGFNNLAYEDSFLNNSLLCVDDPAVKLPKCSAYANTRRFSSKHLALVVTLVVVVLLVTGLLAFLVVRDFLRKRRLRRELETWKLTSFHKLEFSESLILSSLTESNMIGSGGSGQVYRVPVNRSGGDYVAVKKIWNKKIMDHKLEKEFLAEVEILGTIRHANIVKLWCCISSENSKLLVYEYMEKQSLDRWLHVRKRKATTGTNSVHHVVLDWPTRLQIAIGAAQGLCYMHHDCSPQIIHRDVKSSNILLDSEFKAKIADFGLAKMLVKHGEPHTMSAVAGSFGYFAPEYAYTTKVNEKIDIYSFGVVLLELVTGREANFGDEYTNLAEWAWNLYAHENPIPDVLDEEIKESCHLEEMTTVFKLGLMCTSTSPSTRPSMKEVLQILHQCHPDENNVVKKLGCELDADPVLGSNAFLYGFTHSKKGAAE